MHVGAKRLFGQPANACFCPCEEARFCEKKTKIMQFLGPKNGGPFLNLQPPAPIKFSLTNGTGHQKWGPKMGPKNGAPKNEKMMAEASRNYYGKAVALTCNRNLGLYLAV